MILSEEYKNNIKKMFGKVGEEWLETIPDKVEKYKKIFNLDKIEVLNDLTYNILLFAESAEYGLVVLKIEIPFEEMTIRESQALLINNGEGACKCYYSDIKDGVLLLERLIPGISLNTIQNIDRKIEIFNDVADSFNVKLDDNQGLPTYNEILNRSILMGQSDNRFTCINDYLSLALQYYNEILLNNDCNYLLHSDMYGDNILLSNGQWKVIDPHGFVGPKIIDTAIFLQKELEKNDFNNNYFDLYISKINKHKRYHEIDLYKTLFVNYVLNICWDIEVNFDSEHINKCLKRVNLIKEIIEEKEKEKNQIKILKKS